jgi:hypothetical protein
MEAGREEKMSHRECRHCPIGAGACYCTRTRVIYIQPDEVPTAKSRKVRGDRFDVFCRKAREVSRVLRNVPVLGIACLSKGLLLPSQIDDFESIVDLLLWVAAQSGSKEETK